MKLQLVVLSGVLASTAAFAGPEKIKYPSDYLKGVLYQTLDRPDNKQYRELYATPAAIEAVRKGQPIPSGTVLTLVQWSVQQDDKGNPIKDANGRFIKKDIIAHTVMEKRAGWGADYPADWPRNGEWEYAVFGPDGQPNEKANANNKACFTCHLPHAKQDFVISLAKLNNTFPAAQAAAKAKPAAKSEVNIASFAFMPAKVTADGGQAADLRQHRRHAAPDHGDQRAEERGVPARAARLDHDRQGRRVQLHLRAAPQHEGRDQR